MRWRILFLFLCVAIAAGCNLESQLGDAAPSPPGNDGGNDDDDDPGLDAALACMHIEENLTVDLRVSSATPPNAYERVTFREWCLDTLFGNELDHKVGNAASWRATEDDPVVTATSFSGRATRPELAQGARLDIHMLPASGTIPFVRRIHFLDWEGPNGTCQLEMRVYQKDIGATGKRPLLYFHGGGWRNRTTTMLAAEILVPHMIESHVVFMPSYPLILDKDGPKECQQASFQDILDTARAALEWVEENGSVFGVIEGAPVDAMGHSAGGQLATWVATQHPGRVARFINFYGPTEFAQFIDEARPGGLYEEGHGFARRTLSRLLGVDDLAGLERPYDELVMQNSLSEIVAAEGPGVIPPFLFVLGNADTTVPVEQAVTSCNALGGNASEAGGTYACGANGSRVIIVDGADHNFERRCPDDVLAQVFAAFNDDMEADDICPTANADEAEVVTALKAAYAWLRAP